MATTDCALVALDAASGKEIWTVPSMTTSGLLLDMAPLAVRGKIILGYSGGEVGVRGSISAFDALTGNDSGRRTLCPRQTNRVGDLERRGI